MPVERVSWLAGDCVVTFGSDSFVLELVSACFPSVGATMGTRIWRHGFQLTSLLARSCCHLDASFSSLEQRVAYAARVLHSRILHSIGSGRQSSRRWCLCVVTVCLAAPAECSLCGSSGPPSTGADRSFRPAALRSPSTEAGLCALCLQLFSGSGFGSTAKC